MTSTGICWLLAVESPPVFPGIYPLKSRIMPGGESRRTAIENDIVPADCASQLSNGSTAHVTRTILTSM